MKKILAITIIGLLVLSSIFAGAFNFNLGAAAMYNRGFKDLVEEKKITINDFSFGAATDIKIAIIDVGATALYSKVNNETILNGIITADLALDIAIVRIAAGIGYDYVWDINQKIFVFGGVDNFADFKDAELLAHADFEIMLDTIHIGLFGSLPTGLTFNNFMEKIKEINFDKFWERMNYGLSVKFALI